MAWYDALVNIFRRRSSSPVARPLYDRDTMPMIDSRLLSSWQEMYTTQISVATGVDMVASECSLAPFGVWFGGAEVLDHPFTVLLNDPNPVHTGYELLYGLFADLDLFGNAYWYLAGDSTLDELWPLAPQRMRVVPHPQKMVGGYVYGDAGHEISFDPSRIVHFRRHSTKWDWYGDSRLLAARYEVSTEQSMAAYSLGFFSQDVAQPAGMWALPESLSTERYEEAKKELRELHGGKRRTAIVRGSVDGASVEWKSAGLTQEEMSFIEGRELTRKLILDRLGVPGGLMSEASTEAHARVAERRFLHGIHGRHVAVAKKLTKEVLPLYGESLEFKFADVRQADMTQVAARVQAARDFLSLNELREILGYGPIDESELMNANSEELRSPRS